MLIPRCEEIKGISAKIEAMGESLQPFVLLLHTGYGPDHWDLMLDVAQSSSPCFEEVEPASSPCFATEHDLGCALDRERPLSPDARTLETWQILADPALLTGEPPWPAVKAHALPPHRRAYLTHEGPVPGDRGQVRRVDAGTYTCEQHTPRRRIVQLHGQGLDGTFLLTRSADHITWELQRLA
jgi:hypothetical protein